MPSARTTRSSAFSRSCSSSFVLLLTFKSVVATPLLLILVIQGSVWINFRSRRSCTTIRAFPGVPDVSSIMMGANIDYAIVISSRYLRLKEEMPYKEAMIEALNQAFPTVVTSGTILAAAGMSIGFLSSENTVASIGICLGRGTLISMVLVMCVLPQILLLGDSLVEKTSRDWPPRRAAASAAGAMRVNGHVRGYINGYVDAEIHGRVSGTVSASIDIGNVQMEEAPAQTVPAADLHGEEGSDEADIMCVVCLRWCSWRLLCLPRA
ncbi:MAG: MMPL family transporter [Oscillospiraceae bacterium]